jgi:hypothetical protein
MLDNEFGLKVGTGWNEIEPSENETCAFSYDAIASSLSPRTFGEFREA